MQKHYNPETIEQKWYKFWEDRGYFSPGGDGKPYCIMIPPPNVTGTLHMGHAFQLTIMDALIRYHKMTGRDVLWQMGTDHAGIATQMVVERQLAKEGISRLDLGREKFIEKVWDWKAHSGGRISEQLKRLGAAVDWSRERFTMDEGLSQAVREVFVSLFDQGLIYRGKRLVNWDPVLHTAVSDLEVISAEEEGFMWYMRYPFADGSGHIVIATTRPETMLGDCAVAVHPQDERYRDYIGKEIDLPLTGRKIRLIADEYVDREFGTGAVKITPAHDFNDYEVGLRHKLLPINILTVDARINDDMPEKYRGLDRFAARKQIVADLKFIGLLEKIEAHRLKIPRGDRSGSVVEPLLTDQWFVKTKELAHEAIKAVNDKRIKFVPANWKNTYYRWLEDIQDWCVSRQIWWGHRIPAWFDENGAVYVAHSERDAREKYGIPHDTRLKQDEDVLDTWFSSALWPFSTLGWPEKTAELAKFYPTSVLVTGFDIIFFWVARMIMFGLKFMGDAPFREVYIHGLVRDSHGVKMSKSKGNVLDPIDLIDGIKLDKLITKRTDGLMQEHLIPAIIQHTKEDFPQGIKPYGADALRFTFASLASTGRDISFDVGRIEGCRNFCNKLWNAARFVKMRSNEQHGKAENSPADLWILSLLQEVTARTRGHIASYRFDLASQTLYDFIWNEYCDWYLELSKAHLNREVLLEVLSAILRLLHPLMPYITEEIWNIFAPDFGGGSIMNQAYPEFDDSKKNLRSEEDIKLLKEVVIAVRHIRSEMNIPPGKKVNIVLKNGAGLIDRFSNELKILAHLDKLNTTSEDMPDSAVAIVGEMKIFIPLADLIDRAAELARIDKDLTAIKSEIARINNKLANRNFVTKAPQAVVAKEQDKLVKFNRKLEQITRQRETLGKLA